ncbi:glutathione S-transferase family protein, partial [Methylobacterium radiotolerans]|uniref:glutathione S-transferase family protein n=1 Tax=Methylobacterium radiotolerans TaxID=31998 RepID=UPI001FD88C2D
ICEYLDGLSSGPHLFPEGAARWDALTRQALADGLLDAALLTRYERVLRPESQRWDAWEAGQVGKIRAALDRFESLVGGMPALDIGTVALGCALGYLDLRFPEPAWREGRPAVGAVVIWGGSVLTRKQNKEPTERRATTQKHTRHG